MAFERDCCIQSWRMHAHFWNHSSMNWRRYKNMQQGCYLKLLVWNWEYMYDWPSWTQLNWYSLKHERKQSKLIVHYKVSRVKPIHPQITIFTQMGLVTLCNMAFQTLQMRTEFFTWTDRDWNKLLTLSSTKNGGLNNFKMQNPYCTMCINNLSLKSLISLWNVLC